MQRIQKRWIKKRAWLAGTFLLLAVIFLFSSVPVLASSSPKTARHLTPLASHVSGQYTLTRAAVCFGNACNGLDPYTSGCSASFYEVAGVTAENLRVELEYSSLCGTNWTQVYRLDHRPGYVSGCVIREAGSDGGTLGLCYFSHSFWWINTDMVYAPHNLAQACGNNGIPFGICTDQY